MKKAFTGILLIFAAINAFSMSFSLQVIQRDTPTEDVIESSYLVEQTVLDYFFDRGCIVSSNAIIVSKNDEADDKNALRHSFVEAKVGCMDLIIHLNLYFNIKESTNPEAVLLSNLKGASWEIVSLETGKRIAHGEGKPGAVTEKNNNSYGIESFAKDIAKNIQTALAN